MSRVIKPLKINNDKPDDKGYKQSTFFVTLNTNQADLSVDLLLEKWTYYYNHLPEFLNYRRAYDKLTVLEEMGKILDVEGEVSAEIGSKFGRVHLHAIIKIKHNTNLSIDFKRCREYFKSELKVPDIHLHVDFIRSNEMTLKHYLLKNPAYRE